MNTTTQRLAPLLVAILVVASVATVGLAGSVAAQGTDEANEPTVRVFHASPDAGPVDVYVDGVLAVGNVGYGSHATTSLPVGDHTVTLTEAGNENNTLAEANLTLEQGTRYTVVASGSVGAGAEAPLGLTVFEGAATAPGDDQTAVRLAHLSPDAGPVDVTVNETGDVLFENVTFQNSTEFVTVPSGNYTVDVREATATNDGPVVRTVSLSLEGGTVASAFAIGYVAPQDGDERVGFRILVLRDAGAEPAADENGGTPEATATPPGNETTPGTDAGNETTPGTDAGNETTPGTDAGNETTETGTAGSDE